MDHEDKEDKSVGTFFLLTVLGFFHDRRFGEYRIRLTSLILLGVLMIGILFFGFFMRKREFGVQRQTSEPLQVCDEGIRSLGVDNGNKTGKIDVSTDPDADRRLENQGAVRTCQPLLWSRKGEQVLTSLGESVSPQILSEQERMARTQALVDSEGTAAAMQAADAETILRAGDPAVLHHAGVVALAGGDIGKARLYFCKALEIAPFAPATLFNLAQIEFDAGDYEKAHRLLGLYRQRNPNNKIAAYRAVVCALKLGVNVSLDEKILPISSAPGLYARAAIAANKHDREAVKMFVDQARMIGDSNALRFESDLRLFGLNE